MTTEYSLLNMKSAPDEVIEQMRVHRWTWRSGGAAFGLCGGILSPLIGSILTAISWITGPVWHGLFLQRDGTVLLFLTIPLLILGAHCLDLMERHDQEPTRSRTDSGETSGFRDLGRKNNDLGRD